MFLTNDAAATSPSEIVADLFATTARVPDAIRELESIYRDEMALRLEVQAKIDALEGRLSSTRQGSGHLWSTTIPFGGRDGVGIDNDVLGVYIDRVTAYAEKALSRDGAPFLGSLDQYARDLRDKVNRHHYRVSEAADRHAYMIDAFSPIRAWEAIERQYDPDTQRLVANRKAAQAIRGFFGMLRNGGQAMKVVKGRAEISITVWTEPAPENTRRFGYQSTAWQLGAALQQFAANAGMTDAVFGTNYAALCQSMGYAGERRIVSRERVDLGNGVDVVLGFNAFKLYLPLELAGQINMFLSEYPEAD